MDPNILVSVINLKLRDYYKSIEDLCDDMDLSESELVEKLKKSGFTYKREINQFK